jgi:hypothetical protein
MKIFNIVRAIRNETPMRYNGKGAPAPIPTPPVEAPPPVEEATLETTPVEADKKKAQTLGAKSLQIPLGTIGGDKPLNI